MGNAIGKLAALGKEMSRIVVGHYDYDALEDLSVLIVKLKLRYEASLHEPHEDALTRLGALKNALLRMSGMESAESPEIGQPNPIPRVLTENGAAYRNLMVECVRPSDASLTNRINSLMAFSDGLSTLALVESEFAEDLNSDDKMVLNTLRTCVTQMEAPLKRSLQALGRPVMEVTCYLLCKTIGEEWPKHREDYNKLLATIDRYGEMTSDAMGYLLRKNFKDIYEHFERSLVFFTRMKVAMLAERDMLDALHEHYREGDDASIRRMMEILPKPMEDVVKPSTRGICDMACRPVFPEVPITSLSVMEALASGYCGIERNVEGSGLCEELDRLGEAIRILKQAMKDGKNEAIKRMAERTGKEFADLAPGGDSTFIRQLIEIDNWKFRTACYGMLNYTASVLQDRRAEHDGPEQKGAIAM